MKRIMLAIHALSHDGAEKVAAMWANYLTQKGHQVAFLVRYRLEKEQTLDDRIKIFSIAETSDTYLSTSAIKRLIAVRKIAKEYAPDIIISLLPKMQVLVMLATWGIKCKRFETIRNNPWLDKDIGRKRLLWNLCFLRSDRIILQTEEQSDYFSKRIQKKCVVIRNPILHKPESKQYQNGSPKRFVAVGRVSEQKNYIVMISAFAEAVQNIEDCTLDIYGVGSPTYTALIQEHIDAVGLHERVKLCGWTDKISDNLLRHDAFLMSSNYEGMPNALAEAMAVGLVCLSADCRTGPKDMIDPGKNGFLAITGDEQSFAEGIKAITKMNLQQCIAMGAAAREKILEMCSEENTLARLNQLIETEM